MKPAHLILASLVLLISVSGCSTRSRVAAIRPPLERTLDYHDRQVERLEPAGAVDALADTAQVREALEAAVAAQEVWIQVDPWRAPAARSLDRVDAWLDGTSPGVPPSLLDIYRLQSTLLRTQLELSD